MRVSVRLIRARGFGCRVARRQITRERLWSGALAAEVARCSDKAASLPKQPNCFVYQYLLLESLGEGKGIH